MEVGKSITGSPILQTADSKEYSITAVDRSDNHVKKEPIEQSIELTKDQAKSMVDGLNSFLEPTNTGVRYEFHEKLEKYYVTLVNRETDEVIREIPPKKLLDVYASMAELMGFIVDEKI